MKKQILGLILTVVVAAACGGNKSQTKDEQTTQQAVEQTESMESAEATEPAETAESQGGHKKMMQRCPMHVEGTTLSTAAADGGVALEFTNEANVAEVQKRTAMMAEHHPMAMEHHGSSLPAYTVSTENTETGAKLVLKADAAEEAATLAEAVESALSEQGDKQCPMMVMYDHEPKHGPASAPSE